MRRFIYLDTDTLNSYLAQIFDGLIQSHETEKSNGKKREKHNRFSNSLGGQIAFKLFGKGIEANAEATYEHLKTVADDEMVKDVQTKIIRYTLGMRFTLFFLNDFKCPLRHQLLTVVFA